MRKTDFPLSRGYSKQRDHGQSGNAVVGTEKTLDPSIEYFYMYEIFILAVRLAESRFIPPDIPASHPLASSKDEKILGPLTVKEGCAAWFRKEILDDLRFVPQKRTIVEDIFSQIIGGSRIKPAFIVAILRRTFVSVAFNFIIYNCYAYCVKLRSTIDTMISQRIRSLTGYSREK